ncbi:MAG: murein biosynthesis integral membrane protein MurJ [Salinisphaeraceae bacterium]|nr:murein biosynthesis integral membrane protein MurJ [Salinisphaeraceae bacterium]
MSKSLMRSTFVVSAMTLISRVMGLIRDVLFATLFAASAGMDAFLIAFKIPNFGRRLFAEGAFNQAFVPVLTETKTRNEEEVRELVNVVAGTLGGILIVVTIVGVVIAPLLIMLFAPGFIDDPRKFDLTSDMLRITFPYLLFISLTAFAGGILNSYGRFAVPAFTPVLLNVCFICAAIWLAPQFEEPVMALAIGVFIAGVVQLSLQIPFLARLGLLPRPRWGWAHERVRRIIKLMLPVLFGSSVAQISLLLDMIVASFLVTGSVSWLYYSDRLMEFPLGVFSIAVATVILPALSARHAEASAQAFSHTMDWALRLLLIIGTPAMVALFVLSGPLLVTLFQYNAFTAQDVIMSRYSLMAYAFGFMGFSLVKVLLPGFYSRQDTRTPVRFGVIALLVNMVLNVGLVVAIVMLEGPAPHAGLALATSAGAFVNAGLLYRRLRADGIYLPEKGWASLFLKALLANAVMIAVLLWLGGDLDHWLALDLRARLQELLILVVAGAGSYFLVLVICGLRPRQFIMSQH